MRAEGILQKLSSEDNDRSIVKIRMTRERNHPFIDFWFVELFPSLAAVYSTKLISYLLIGG